MMKLSIVVVLYNEFDLVQNCLKTIYQNAIPQMEVILSDNSDTKGVETVLKAFPNLLYIKNKKNVGYGGGARVGYAKAKGKYVLILTPDTTLFPKTIKQTVAYMEKHTDVALVGCQIFSFPKKLHRSVFHAFPNLLTHLYEYNLPFYKLCTFFSPTYHPTFFSKEDHQKELVVKHMIGAYMLMRKRIIDEVGFFDERYFMYREETDLCSRLYKKGWKIVYLPIAGLIHHENAHKTIQFTQASPYYEQSTYLFFKKQYGNVYAIIAWLVALSSTLFSLVYLLPIVILKKLLRLPSQSYVLFDSWVKILTWHMTDGVKFVLFK